MKGILIPGTCQGQYEFELVRIKGLEETGKNPWRVRKHKCILTLSDGNPQVMEPMKDAPVVTRRSKAMNLQLDIILSIYLH